MPRSHRAALVVATAMATLTAGGLLVAVEASAAAGCRVDYRITSQWQGGFGAEVSITNLGDPVNGWRLEWSYSAGQAVTQAWNAQVAQRGPAVTATNVGHNAGIATAGRVAFGFNGSSTGANLVPTGFTLNGTACIDVVAPSTSPSTAPSTSPTASPSTSPTASPGTTPSPTSGTPAAGVLAFPGAVGFAATATGGRGGSVYRVTNLNDSGAGSLRDAVSQSNRIVVFDVGGYIELASPLAIKSNITIAGQTAPGDGIGTRGYQVSLSNASNVIVRYLRFRHGLTPNQNRDGVTINGGSNLILDHVSVSWGRDENFSINSSVNVTVQNSIISEGLDPHSCGGLVQSDGVTLYRNLYAHNKTRNPKVKGRNQFVNNVVYNWGSDAYIQGDSAGRSDANVIGNYFVKGPTTGSGGPFTRGNTNFHMYASGNLYDPDKDGALDGRALSTAELGSVVLEQSPFPFPAVPASDAAAAYQSVIAHAGASLRRDAVDRRVIGTVTGQSGAIITDPATVGGFGSLTGGTAPGDADRDGMADSWERANGLSPASAADGPTIGADGYSNVERYLNSLVP